VEETQYPIQNDEDQDHSQMPPPLQTAVPDTSTASDVGEPDTDYEHIKSAPGYMVFSALVFITLLPLSLFAFAKGFLLPQLLFPDFGQTLFPLYYVIHQVLLFHVVWGLFCLIGHYQELIPWLGPDRFTRLAERFSRATGQRGRDSALAAVSAVLLCFCLVCTISGRISYLQHLPLFIIGTETFLVLASKANREPWPVKPTSALIPSSPDEIPALPEKGKHVILEWAFPRLSSEMAQETIPLRILEEQYLAGKAACVSPGIPDSQLPEAIETALNSDQNQIVFVIAAEIQRITTGLALTFYEVLGCCLALVQSIPMETKPADDVAGERYKTPIETLFENSGTSVDRAILLFSVLRLLYPIRQDAGNRSGPSLELWINTHKRFALVAIGDKDLPLPDDFYRAFGHAFYIIDPAQEGKVGRLPRGSDPSSFIKIGF
jgi:hypothetical protein